MDRTTQLAINQLFVRDDNLAEELLKTKKALRCHKVANFAIILYLTYTVLRHEAELEKLKNKDD
jgi:hypothetical protein